MKFPKLKTGAVSAIVAVLAKPLGKLVQDKVDAKIKYDNEKHNGYIKYISVLLSLISVFIVVYSIKEAKFIFAVLSFFAFISYVITLLYCLEIIKEKKKNTYKMYSYLGDVLLLLVASFILLFL